MRKILSILSAFSLMFLTALQEVLSAEEISNNIQINNKTSIVMNDSVLFDYPVDTTWIHTNDKYEAEYEGETFRFHPQTRGKYVVATGLYNVDVEDIVDNPYLPEVSLSMKSYVIENKEGNITITEGDDYYYPSYEPTQDTQEVFEVKKRFYDFVEKEIDQDHYFEYIMIRGNIENPTPKLRINSTQNGVLTETYDYPGNKQHSFKLKCNNEISSTNLKRYTIQYTPQDITYSSSITNVHQIAKVDNETFTIYQIDVTNGELVPSSLSIEKYIQGDVNGDMVFDISDVVLLQRWLLAVPDTELANWKAADFCADNKLDVLDLCLMKRALIEEMNKATTTETLPVVFEMSPSKEGVDEFLANNPTIKSTYKDDELFNITPQEITDNYGFKIFKYSENCETYLEYKEKTYQLGSGWGGPGTVSFAVADLNKDGYYELYFTYSCGSGINSAAVSCFDITSSFKFEGFNEYSDQDFVFAVENGKLGVYKAKYTSAEFVKIKTEPTEKTGEIIADNDTKKIVFVPINSRDTDLDKSAIAGKIFAYEKEGAGGYCTLSFNENGRFLYYPGKLSSYMDGGDWKVDGNTVSLIGMENKTIYLKITDDTLVYIAEGSDEFPYMDIKDGEKFVIYRPEISSDMFQLNSRYTEYGLGDPKIELDLIASELPELCYVEDVRLYDEDDNFIGKMSPAMDADIWSYLVDCNVTEECSMTYYTLTKILCRGKTYLDNVRSEITVNFKVTPAP